MVIRRLQNSDNASYEKERRENMMCQTQRMQWFLSLCGVVVTAYLVLWVRLRRTRALLAGLPSFPQLPFLGNMMLASGGGKYIFRLIDQISKISDEKMKPFVFWVGPCPVLVCHDPDDVRTIANNLIEKPYLYSFGKVWLGDGLVTAPASLWKQNVKKLAGTFSTSVVEGYQSVFNAQAQKLVARLKTRAGQEPFDAMHYLAQTTLEAICETALGVARISESVGTEQYYQAFNRGLELFIARGLNLLLHPECIYQLTPAHREMAKCVAVIHNVSDTVMKQRKMERAMIKKNGNPQEKDGQFRPVLDILLDVSESDPLFTEQQIRAEVDTIILGGQETVASTLFYTLLMLGCRPKVQEKIYEEMKSIFGESKRAVEKEDLPRMVYCEAIINETLRLFPPLPGVMRYADREVQLKSCRVPRGTLCAINVWGAGRSPRAWGPDAADYNPERWLTGALPSSAAFIPFSYGRRSCIGKRYAMTILKTVLAYCVRELEFSSEADHMQFKIDIALRAISGHLMQVKLRQ